MHREPSIHITKKDFFNLMKELMPIGVDIEGLTNKFFFIAKPYSLHTRTISISTEHMEKKAKRLVQSSRRDADLLAQLIYATRKRMKHRGITPIKVGSRDWGVLKEITAHALNFTNEFNLTRRYGFLKYIQIGLSKMKKFNINKFPVMYEGIYETYQAMLEIEKDKDTEMTNLMYRAYAQRVIENTGMHDVLEQLPERYVWFVRAREQAEKLNVSVKIYMQAQFDGFDFSKGIPHPTQLVGTKAIERVIRYCFTHGIKVNKK